MRRIDDLPVTASREGRASKRRALAACAAAIAVGIASPAAAVDGVRLVNQLCAVQTGCFPGDAAGFPVTISAPGQYRLSSALAVSDAALDGIRVETDDVSIDLNGFEIAGPVTCTGEGPTLSCTFFLFPGQGIRAGTRDRVAVRDGTVRGFALGGVLLGDGAHVADLLVEENGSTGVSVGDGSLVRHSIAYHNDGIGIFGVEDVVLEGNVAVGNGSDGLSAGAGGSVVGCASRSNGGHGIRGGVAAVIQGSASVSNDDEGIHVDAGSRVTHSCGNGNGSDGIRASFDSSLQGNAATGNGEYGFDLAADATYRENVVSPTNGLGTVLGGANLGGNACSFDTTCP